MWRIIITVLLGGILHGVGCIITPPFEFGKDRPTEFFFAFISGLISTAVFVALVFLPMRAALRRILPGRAPQIHAIVAIAALLVLLTAVTVWRVLAHHTVRLNFQSWWAYWCIYVVTCVITLFWQCNPQRGIETNSDHDRAA